MGKSTIDGPFSIATLVYQTVTISGYAARAGDLRSSMPSTGNLPMCRGRCGDGDGWVDKRSTTWGRLGRFIYIYIFKCIHVYIYMYEYNHTYIYIYTHHHIYIYIIMYVYT